MNGVPASGAWSIRCSYFESCWRIDEGAVGDVDVSDLAVALVFAYDDDEEQSPWRWILYLDDQADTDQQLDHTPRRQWLRVGDRVVVRIRDRVTGGEVVTCAIPGHDRDGEELIVVDDSPVAFRYEGTCGYTARFAYAGQ